jgi:2TM family of unknown function (DUF5676)
VTDHLADCSPAQAPPSLEVVMNGSSAHSLRLPLVALGLSLGGFFAISFLACILLGLIVPDGAMHRPWLQFFPYFEWLTPRGVVLGLIWTQVYAWWTALLFGSLFNVFAARFR